jgi:nucleotide-binding universal stress UspA family protein
VATAPNRHVLIMYKNILIATDGSALAHKAVDQGIALAKCLGASVVVVTVTEPLSEAVVGEMVFAPRLDEYERCAAADAGRILAAVDEAARKASVPCTVVHIRDQFPGDGIIEAAKDHGCDLIVMGSHGRRGIAMVLLGSAAADVVTRSTIPVLICR